MNIEAIGEKIGIPSSEWYGRCHEVSMAFLRAGVVKGRVARGWCLRVPGQHSWIMLGDQPEDVDCYSPETPILDPTLWTYDKTVEGLWEGTLLDGRHSPHGLGSIWDAGQPVPGNGPPIPPPPGLSVTALAFLQLLPPLDAVGWAGLLTRPVQGWPSKEIVTRALESDALAAFVPIDIVGMLTDTNPQGLYWPKKKANDA